MKQSILFQGKIQTKLEQKRAVKPAIKLPGGSKESQPTVAEKSEEANTTKMQPESEEAEIQPSPSAQKEETSKDVCTDIQESDKEHVDRASPEPLSVSKVQEDPVNKEAAIEEEQPESQEKAGSPNKTKETEEHEENELNLTFETEGSLVKVQEKKADDKDTRVESDDKSIPTEEAVKNGEQEKQDAQSESQTDTESYSADVLEVTASEVSEASETAAQNDAQKVKGKAEESISKDVSFVSYDPSIMLKDIQIKLNDCLKENSKLLDTSHASQVNSPSQTAKDQSFGKTLRNISGRRSLSRMRHVTLREHRYSPNDSLFVNTSGASLIPDDAADFKILRYSTGLADTLSVTNGSPAERKRKHETADWNSAKKQKTESENSLLNSSISVLKGLRRPIQVSTPVGELKFQSSKLDLDEEGKEAGEAAKKWCVVM